MSATLRALIVQDSEDDGLALRLLMRAGYAVANERVDSLEGMRASLQRQAWDIVIANFRMPGFDGFGALAVLRQHDPEMPFIVVSSACDEEAAVDMMKAGASDYITEGNLARLVPAVQRELRYAKVKQDLCESAAALREGNERFRQLADNIREVFWLTDPSKSEVLYVSPGYEEIWGRKVELLYARPHDWVEAIHPEDRDRVVEAALTKQARGDYDEEYRITRPDGEIRWIRDRAFVVLGEDGKVTRIAGVAEDITERKHAADESRESERRFSDMLRNVELVSLMLDREARITYCNDYLLRITGWKRAEVLGRDWFELFIPPHLTDVKDLFAALMRNESAAWHHENDIVTRAGELRTIRWNNSVLLSASREVIGTASIGEDVTNRKLAETELRRSECIKGAILQSSLDCVITIDHEGQVVEFNPAAEATFGLTREQAIGKPMVDLIVPPDMRDAHRRGFTRHLETGERRLLGKRLELRAIRADGTEFPIELAIASIETAATPLFTAFIRDITARKEAEEKIRRLSRVYEVMSGINSLIVRRNELFRDSCRLIVEAGRFSLAWIAVPDRETMQLNPVAWAGVEHGFVDRVRDQLSLKDPPEAQSLAVRAATTKRPFVSNDIRDDPRIKFAQEHVQFNSRSVGAFPIVVGDDVAAVLVLHYTEVGFFDDDEMKLLLDLCGDIAFALEHIKKSEQVDYLAYYDVLTGLANRTLFRERLEQKLNAAAHLQGKVAVFLLDLEHFKSINDTLGRHVGDELLKQVAQRLVSVGCGDAGRFARISADHFAIVAGDVENEQQVAQYTDQRFRSVFGPPYLVGGHEFTVGAKCGIALFPDDGIDADTLIRNAEAALKSAKLSGERCVF